jgi:tetratricopeptide (TPR) repeat protein
MGLFDWFRRKPQPEPEPERIPEVLPAPRPRPAGRAVGQRVLGAWPDGFFYPATVEAVEPGRCFLRFDDGDAAWVPAGLVTDLDVTVGSRVFARWQGGRVFFPGRVDQQRGQKIHIRYDDGDQEWTSVSMVRVNRAPPPVATPAPAPVDRLGALVRAGDQAFADRDYARAVELSSEAIALAPDDGGGYVRRADAYTLLHRHDEANADYTRGIEMGLDDATLAAALHQRGCNALFRGQYAEAERDLRRALELDPEPDDRWYYHGDALFNLGCRAAAIDSFKRSLEKNPNQPAAWLTRGGCHLKLAQYAEAVAAFDAACRLAPDRHQLFRWRGTAHYHQQNAEAAVADFTRALQLGDEDAGVYLLRAAMYRQLGRLPEALADVETALVRNPADFTALRDRARLLRELGEADRAEAALRELDQVLWQRARGIARNGSVVQAALVMANVVLFDPSSQEDAPCRVLLTFDPVLGKDPQRLQKLARWLVGFKDTHQTDPEMQYVAELTTVEAANPFQRRRLPPRFTDGAVVYVTDLFVYRRFFPAGVSGRDLLACVAEPGDRGLQELIPPRGLECPP